MTLEDISETLVAARQEVVDLTDTTRKLSEKLDVSKRIQRRLWILTGVVVCFLLAGIVMGFYTYRVSSRLDDCINPGGQCYEEQNSRTTTFILQITDANKNGVPDIAEILEAIQSGR